MKLIQLCRLAMNYYTCESFLTDQAEEGATLHNTVADVGRKTAQGRWERGGLKNT